MSATPRAKACPTCATNIAIPFLDPDLDFRESNEPHDVCRLYQRSELLFSEGEASLGLYRIHTGKVKVFKLDESGNTQILRLAGPGNIVGYRSILHGAEHTYSAAAIESAEVCFVPKEDFFELLGDRSSFCLQIAQHLADELDAAENLVVNMARKNIKERLAETLLLLRNTYGERDDGTLNIDLTREDLAGIVGAATESVIRALTVLKEEGYIDTVGRRIRVVHGQNLRQLSDPVH